MLHETPAPNFEQIIIKKNCNKLGVPNLKTVFVEKAGGDKQYFNS